MKNESRFPLCEKLGLMIWESLSKSPVDGGHSYTIRAGDLERVLENLPVVTKRQIPGQETHWYRQPTEADTVRARIILEEPIKRPLTKAEIRAAAENFEGTSAEILFKRILEVGISDDGEGA